MQELFHLLSQLLSWGVLIPLLALCFVHCLMNMRLLRGLKPTPLGEAGKIGIQDVSVLVPARNEERRIRDCLASLIAQEPSVREIIVLDDRSTDETALIARELGFVEEPGARLRLLRGKELPEGWVGKNWACHQLSLAVSPESTHLLFTDADTIHGPACVRSALACSVSTRADLLSLWPDQITGSWSEKLVIPLGYLLFMAFHPFPLLRFLQEQPERVARWGLPRARLAMLGAANGQFLLFKHSSYKTLGGHEALKDHLVEDIAFGRLVASRTGEGMRLMNADGIDLLKCRMYCGFPELWEGFSKNLRPVFEESHLGFALFGVVIFSLFLLPFFLLALKETPFQAPAIMVLLIMGMRLLIMIRFRTSWLGFIAHPFAVILALLIALNSWRLCQTTGVRWKGRNYSGKTRSVLD
jgi:chlorobactene glucosyltransferase